MSSIMDGWIDIGSDANWEDYGGIWAKKDKRDGSWYVIRFMNLWDACGERDGLSQYECDVKRIGEVSNEQRDSALKSCGYEYVQEKALKLTVSIVQTYDGAIIAEGKDCEIYLVYCLVGHGGGAPLESFRASVYPKRVRAEAIRYAKQCMKDSELLQGRLARPVNAIGSTAEEYGRGDTDSALHRGPAEPKKNLMRKLHGMPPLEEPSVLFVTVGDEGTEVRRDIKIAHMRACLFSIIDPVHYRLDGSCMCDDAWDMLGLPRAGVGD
jgi:hypothetical protein